jgi:single-strand DNA-binding protein
MPALNQVQLIGHLGRDPEARFTANGKKYATFTVAVNRPYKTADGEKQQATDWFLVNAWGKLGEICLDYLKKGRLVYIGGQLRSRRWEDRESGEMHSLTVVVANSMQMLDRKADETEEAEAIAEEEPIAE